MNALKYCAEEHASIEDDVPGGRLESSRLLPAAPLIALLLVGAFSGSAQAANSDTWTGGTSGTWSTAANWIANPSAPPGSGDTAIFSTSSSNTSVTLSATTTIQNLNFDAAAANYTIGTTSGPTLKLNGTGIVQILSTLTATNAVETINAPIAFNNTNSTYSFLNNSASGTGAGAGTLNIGGAITPASGTGSTIILGGSNTNLNTISGSIAAGTSNSSLLKIGAGTWQLSGTNAYTGGTTVSDGTLLLNFGGPGAPPTSQIISNSSALTLTGGATLEIKGNSGGTNSQAFASTIIGVANPVNGTTGGADTLDFIQNGASSLSGNLGVISRTAGSTVNFTLPTTGSLAASVTNSNSSYSGTGGILLGQYGAGAYATVGGTDWAAVSGGNIVGLSTVSGGYTLTSATLATGANADVASGSSSIFYTSGTLDSLRFNQGQATTFNVSGTLKIGGILITSNVGSHASSISGGTLAALSANNGADIVIIQNNASAAGALTISSLISGSGNANTNLTVSGPGIVNLTNTGNTYAGPTYINGAILNIAGDGSLGTAPSSAKTNYLVFNGGTLQLGTDITLSSNRGITIGNEGGATIDTNGYTGSYGGIIASATDASGGLTKTGAGSLTLSGSNTYSGGTTVKAGTLAVANSVGSATGSGPLAVGAGATLAGAGTSSGTSFAISGSGSSKATVLVGQAAGGDNSLGKTLTLLGSAGTQALPTSSISNANLVFNLDASANGGTGIGNTNPGASNQLSVGTTNIGFANAVTLTLNLQNEPAIVPAYTPFVLIAGTGGGTTAATSQYTGLTFGASTGTYGSADGETTIITGITGGTLGLLFGNSTDTAFYGANSYLVLYQNTGVDDIEVEVVPEPSTWALMIGGFALLVFIQRRKNKHD